MTRSSRPKRSLRPQASVRRQRTVRPPCVAVGAAGASPARTGAAAALRRTRLCGGPSLINPAGRRGCGAYCLHESVVVAEGRTRGR